MERNPSSCPLTSPLRGKVSLPTNGATETALSLSGLTYLRSCLNCYLPLPSINVEIGIACSRLVSRSLLIVIDLRSAISTHGCNRYASNHDGAPSSGLRFIGLVRYRVSADVATRVHLSNRGA